MIRKIKEWFYWNILHKRVIYIKIKDPDELKELKELVSINKLGEVAADAPRN